MHSGETVLVLANFSERAQSVARRMLPAADLRTPYHELLMDNRVQPDSAGNLSLPPYAVWWLSYGAAT
jgi:hypothetical protein